MTPSESNRQASKRRKIALAIEPVLEGPSAVGSPADMDGDDEEAQVEARP